MKPQAWITSAVDNEAVDKAIILAGSLRRVCTGKSLAVITTLAVSEKLRSKLKSVFDLVHLIERDSSNGLSLEDYAKVEAFSLLAYDKCVYITPNSLVLRNCDDIFRKYEHFAVAAKDNDMDTSVFLFSPNLEFYKNFETFTMNSNIMRENGKEVFPNILQALFGKTTSKVEKIGEEHSVRLTLKDREIANSSLNTSIVIFPKAHPLDFLESTGKRTNRINGTLEKFAIDYAWRIYLEDVKKSPVDSYQILSPNRYKSEPIAVVGMSFRLPGGNSPDEFWSLLENGQNAIIPVPDSRWKKDHSYFLCKNREVEAGFLNIPIDEFDAKFFGLSPKEAEFLDPQQRLLLEVTWEAFEDAMIDPLKIRGTNSGVFVGSWIYDYKDILRGAVDFNFFRTYMGNSIASSASRLSHFFEFTGPSFGTESGCSSAIAAVDMACKSLRNGNSNFAVAAGVNLLLHSFDSNSLECVLSPEYRCKTFDANADGFARAEGCAVLLLKRLSDAVKDNDNIWGLIRGTALTQEGVSKSLGTPTIHCESLAMRLALKEAGVHPKDVSYIEAHGTGTAVGDPMEIKAIQKAYSEGRTEPLVIGSVKTNVGHTESVSGLTGLIKVLLSMKNELIPKHLNLETLNPNINLEAIPAKIPLDPIAWPKSQNKSRIAGVSSFGISGTDGHAIVEEPPVIPRNQVQYSQERPLHIMKISAKSPESMDELVQQYLRICKQKIEQDEDNEKDFANLAFSANIGRATFNHRAVIVAKNHAEAVKILEERSFKQMEVKNQGSSLCFLFTGQGSQYPNMAKQLYETSPNFKENFDKCDDVLRRRYNLSIKDVLWSSESNNDELSRTLFSQTSIFVVEYCLLKLWESWGVKADYVMGHSLGEFAAAVAAGALNFEDALMLVAERSRLIDNLPRGKMLVIKADKKTVDETISAFQKVHPNFWIDYAAINSSEQTVVAGDSEMIEDFSKFCAEKSLKSIVLAATHAFHSRHMEPMLDAYRKVAKTVKTPVTCNDHPKYISGMEGKLVDVEDIDAEYWVRHTREKVSFMDACKVAQGEGCNLFLEVGPHPVLSALTMMNMDGHNVTCLPSICRKQGEWMIMLESLSKLYLSEWKGEIDWAGFDRIYNRQKVKLPFYPFNRKPIWTKVETVPPKVHPLIGSIVPTAKGDTIYQSSLTLQNTSFVKDHVIGNTVVFPGAGFLEMCLAGGYSNVQGFTENIVKPRRPILIKSLKISTPLAFNESSICKLQTVINLDDNKNAEDSEVGYAVEVYRQTETIEGTGQWIQHASAKFLPVVPSLSTQATGSHDISIMQSTWEKSDNKDFYEKLPEVGLRFGPKFQSLECAWKSENGILASIKVPEDYQDYLIHPVVADAMIQAAMLWTSQGNLKKKLYVPVQINEFIWLREPETSNLFVFCSTDDITDDTFCALVDETGSTLALMKGVELVETTAKLVENMIIQQSTAMPKIWQNVWRTTRGPLQGYLTHGSPVEEQRFSEEELKLFDELNTLPEAELKSYYNLVNIVRLEALRGLLKLGLKPDLSKPFSVESLMKGLKIKENFREYVRFHLRTMASEDFGLLTVLDSEENVFKFIKNPPTNEEIEMGIERITNPSDLVREEYRLIWKLGKDLDKILIGEVNPLAILFPDDPAEPSAGKYYESCGVKLSFVSMEIKARMHIRHSVDAYTKLPNQQHRPTYRILEVGAGTGVFTNQFIPQLTAEKDDNFDYEYYLTDVSAAFFPAAEKNLEAYMKHLVFKKYDMEKDPLEQGYTPGYFDLITATEVFHIAKDVKETMKRVRTLLKPGGLLLTEETVYPDEKATFVFGLLDGYWQFQDRYFRKNHVSLTPEMWEEAMIEAGFHGVNVTPSYNSIHGVISGYAAPVENTFLKELGPPRHSWIVVGEDGDDFTASLCHKLENVNRKVIMVPKPKHGKFEEMAIHNSFKNAFNSASDATDVIEGVVYLWSMSPNTHDQTKISLPFVTLMKLVSELRTPTRAFAVLRGAQAMENFDVVDPFPGTLSALCKSLMNENFGLSASCLDLDPHKDLMDQVEELFMNIWVDHGLGTAFRDGQQLRPRLIVGKVFGNDPLSLPSGCDRYQLALPKTRLISDLEFTYLGPYLIGDNEVEIQVKAMALNFRDVFTVLKPIKDFENFNTVGLDYSGVITRIGSNVTKYKVGDKVIGMNTRIDLSLPSHICAQESRIARLHEKMTFAEGATIPAVFSTTVYCLLHLAKIKKGETILIHTASGGVGLMAIQLCKFVGANIIATAGSRRKRNYLKNLGIKHVFHSRTTDFKNEILEVTGGRGVDAVLNSITGPGFKEASMDALCKNGRFIEMSKLNAWTPEEVKSLRPDVYYELVDLTQLSSEKYDQLTEELKKFIDLDYIKPIPYERFDALNIRGALNYLQKAKHIGKIVCIMPEVRLEKSKLIATTPLFNEESTYIVTGGLGGIGFEVVKWMLNKGAKHIVTMSRSPPKPEIAEQIKKWNEIGKHIQAFPIDVGNFDMCKQLFEDLKKPELGFPQIRGVMHAAGVLHDAILANQTWDTYAYTYNPKVSGSWNLHELTKDCMLEHFVFFSSVASAFGGPGQSNHSASNAFEDSLASYRKYNGLPATCVHWGNWGEVGVATEVDFPGIKPISTLQGLLALETFLTTQTNHMTVLNVESFSPIVKMYPLLKQYVDDVRLLGEGRKPIMMNSDEFWNEVDKAANRDEKLMCFKKIVKTVIRNILKMDADEVIDDSTEFETLGIDSLMMLEMKNGMQNILGTRMVVSANQLKDCNTTEILANTLLTILEGGHRPQKKLSPEELRQLIREDSELFPEIPPLGNSKSISSVETVLLTGATGNLGPYLLRELTKMTQLKTIYCLVRARENMTALERLKSRLANLEMADEVKWEKVEIVEGGITAKQFGLSDEAYADLCDKVDGIIHSAVHGDHTAKYWKAPETNENNLRTVNVLGLVNLMEFAATGTVKHFFHASSMVAFTGQGKDGEYSEGWQAVTAFDSLDITDSWGYMVSKHIAEQLVYQGILKGIPCKAFRFPVIAGDSKTGRVDYEKNHPILRWLACMKIGAIHDLPLPISAISVDNCAKLSLEIFFNPDAPMDVFNVVPPQMEVEQVMVEVAQRFGIQLEIVSYTTFIEKLRNEDKGSPIAAFLSMYSEEEFELTSIFDRPPVQVLEKYATDGSIFLDSSKMKTYALNYDNLVESSAEVLARDFEYLRDKGIFEKFGIN